MYSVAVRAFRLLLRLFFRRIEVTGLENLPKEGGAVLVSWHPNGLVDPGLIFTQSPAQVIFGARHGLFKFPLLGWVMRGVGTVPIYRAIDQSALPPEERQKANAQSLDALAEAVAGGAWSCLFPEGDSHDSPYLLDLKTGAARFWYRARELSPKGSPEPVIVPVGLHYDAKRAFRSSVLVAFHPPLSIPDALRELPADADDDDRREACRAVTGIIDSSLREVVHATESWELHHLMHRARKLVRAERGHRAGSHLQRPGMVERTWAFARVWAAFYARRDTHPEQVVGLMDRVRDYDADLRALSMEDHELDRGPKLWRPGLALALLIQATTVFFFLPPLFLIGIVVNAPAALGLLGLSKLLSKRKKDEATVKLLFGAVAFPLSWVVAGLIAARLDLALSMLMPQTWQHTPWITGVVAAVLTALGGPLALRYFRLARETARALRVRLTRARRRATIARLRVERSDIFDGFMELVAGLALPGSVDESGRVHRETTAPKPQQ